MISLVVLAYISIAFSLTTATYPPQNYQQQTVSNFYNGSKDGVEIIDAKPAKAKDFPWQVTIFPKFYKNVTRHCGGALISKQWVLTAARCVFGAYCLVLHFGGETLSRNETGKIVVTAGTNFTHPIYDKDYYDYDVGLIKLRKPIKFSKTIRKIKLLSGNDIPVGSKVKVSGFGQSHPKDKKGKILMWRNLTIISNDNCLKYFDDDANSILCAAGKAKEEICHGDSGNPLVFYKSRIPYHVGVHSFRFNESCDRKYPSIFVRTTSVLDWIAEKTGITM